MTSSPTQAATARPSALRWVLGVLAALLLVLADLVIRSIPVGNELHLGTLAALVGAPMFALIALRMGSRRYG